MQLPSQLNYSRPVVYIFNWGIPSLRKPGGFSVKYEIHAFFKNTAHHPVSGAKSWKVINDA
jgi:hypothetical protein